MKKNYLFTTIVLVAIVSCTKSTDLEIQVIIPRINEEPLAAYINSDPGVVKLQVHDPQQKEVGYAFQSTKKGKLYAMGVRMPQAGEDFTVTLWDSASHQIIKQKTITNYSSSSFSYIDLSSSSNNEEVDIAAGKTYVITVNTSSLTVGAGNRQWYMMSKTGVNSDFLPALKGNIQIREGMYTSIDSPTPVFPDKTNFTVFGLHLLFGLTDIGFYATE